MATCQDPHLQTDGIPSLKADAIPGFTCKQTAFESKADSSCDSAEGYPISMGRGAPQTAPSAEDPMRPMLEEACRETLREIARLVAGNDANGSQSLESVVKNVSAKLLEGGLPEPSPRGSDCTNTSVQPSLRAQTCVCGNVFLADSEFCRHCGLQRPAAPCGCGEYWFTPDSQFCRKCGAKKPAVAAEPAPAEEKKPKPLLRDIVATPFVIWREKKPILRLLHSIQQNDKTRDDRPGRKGSFADDTPHSLSDHAGLASRRGTAPPGGLLTSLANQAGLVCNEDGGSETLSRQVSDWGNGFSDEGTNEEDFSPVSPKSAKIRGRDYQRPDRRRRSISSEGRADGRSEANKNKVNEALVDVCKSSRSPFAHDSQSGSVIGEQPTIYHNGLTMLANTMHSLQMQWQGRPRACLMVVKKGDHTVQSTMMDMARFLIAQGVLIVLEPQFLKDNPNIKRSLHGVRTFSAADRLERSIDLLITIGGDGTLTWAVNLFQRGMPPVLAFAAGSLGFLTPFPLESWIRTLTSLLDLHRHRPPQPLVCRMRLRVSVRRKASPNDPVHASIDSEVSQCLNEVLVHRGASSCLAKLNVGVDGEQVTLVQGDGLILATPTGSTAYSLAAGGSMVHPSVPGILLTPVSPHSLSFRPALLPDSAVISVGVPLNARSGAAVSVDGKDLCTLEQGDAVEVAMSPFPVPTICHTGETKDWFTSVQSGLQWNTRLEQKPM